MRIAGVLAAVVLACAPACAHKSSSTEATKAEPGGLAVGAPAPAVQLTGTSGAKVALADVLHRHAQTVVVFYRGFW